MNSGSSITGSILIVDDMPVNIDVLFKYLDEKGFRVFVARDGESALEQVPLAEPDLILLDVVMPGIDGFETCRRLKAEPATGQIPVIFMTALSETVDKVKGFEVGAVDYITKPIQHEEVLARINTHLTLRTLQRRLEEANTTLEMRVQERTAELAAANTQLKEEVAERKRTEAALRQAVDELERLKNRLSAENTYLQEEIKTEYNFEEIVGSSPPMQQVFSHIQQVADTDTTVLITGETGTGKELVARALHNHSRRKDSALIKVNCAALPENLIENELFGHEKGAFTGATDLKKGRFELADGGTILLDEIGELPLSTQVKLLRVLQEQEFERVGGTGTIKVDVRVLAATNRNLEEQVAAGSFRADLFYRLNIFPIPIPPLRDRRADIPVLVQYFLRQFSLRMGKNVNRIDQEAIRRLTDYAWPGNVRELNNVIERAVILCRDGVLQSDHLSITGAPVMSVSEQTDITTLEEAERQHILRALEETRWVVGGPSGAARLLDINRTTLLARMKKLGIERGG